MNRMAILFPALLACVAAPGESAAQTLESLSDRVKSVEARISVIESTLSREGRLAAGTSTGAGQTYVIRDGDTVGGIARKFGIPRQALLDANKLSERQPIFIGETLLIPAAPENRPAADGAGSVHLVRAGDTLIGLSRSYGTSIEAIKQANRLTSDIIAKGQELIIPSGKVASAGGPGTAGLGTPAGAASGIQQTASTGQYRYDNPLLRSDETYGYYAVQKGDNLYALARDFFTTMKELQRLNEMGAETTIYPGDELIVPTSKYNDYHKSVAAGN